MVTIARPSASGTVRLGAAPPSDRGGTLRPRVPEVLRAQAVDPAELRALVRCGELVRIRRGVYGVPAPDGPPWEVARHRLLATAAAVHVTRRAEHWFSHETAALLWGCDLVRVPAVVDVSGPRNPQIRPEPDVRRHWTRRQGRREEVVHGLGLPVTPLERTVLDCASVVAPGDGLVVADSALRAGADPELLEALLGRAAGDRGVRRARAVIALADGRSESAGESLARYVLHAGGLPAPDLQVAVETRIGRRRVDLGWPEQRLALEFDGEGKYGLTEDTVRAALLREKRRQEALEEAGWRVLRVGWRDLSRPSELAMRVARALGISGIRPLTLR
jgi:very-short-patch-repair endonuclease